MKKRLSMMAAGAFCFCLMPGLARGGEVFDSSSIGQHIIGVLVYNNTDDEVIAFRNYLENYVEEVFPDVEFLYSDSISSLDQELDFIQNVSDAGAEGILSFLDYDLESEVALCEQNEVYYMMASSTVSEASFEAVKTNPWFLGVVGPGAQTEYQAGYDMGLYLAGSGSEYFVLTGGAGMGNEMHRQRALGILQALSDANGVSFEEDGEDLVRTAEIRHLQAGGIQVCLCPGYMSGDSLEQARAEYEKDSWPVVISVMALYELRDSLKNAVVGMVDCYSENNLQAFTRGGLSYLTGKYASMIGPSFAAMYNAVTGFAQDFREDGNAFMVQQGFWTSSDADDYVEKYTLSSSIELNAYNYEDLTQMCKRYHPEADLALLEDYAGKSSFEDVKARRNLEG